MATVTARVAAGARVRLPDGTLLPEDTDLQVDDAELFIRRRLDDGDLVCVPAKPPKEKK